MTSGRPEKYKSEEATRQLIMAVENAQTDDAVRAVMAGADIEARNAGGVTPLQIAVAIRDLALIEKLLQMGADPDSRFGQHGYTSLHAACDNVNMDIVALLLEHGADPSLPDHSGDTPLHAACTLGDSKMVQLLLAHGAKADIENNDGQTPYMLADEMMGRCFGFAAYDFVKICNMLRGAEDEQREAAKREAQEAVARDTAARNRNAIRQRTRGFNFPP